MTTPQIDQKNQILEASSQLFMTHGIRSVSMDDLARHLGISKKTIYQFFENKENLVTEVVLGEVQKEKDEVASIIMNSENAIDQMRKIAKMALSTLDSISAGTMFDLQKYYRKQWLIIADLHKKIICSVIEQNIERGIKEGIYRPEINPAIISRLYGEIAFSVVNNDVFPLKEFNISEVYKQAFQYHINGILSLKGTEIFKKLNNTAE